ncbi:MAG: immune inhibitor A [Flavobacteriales bacterium]|nr:MAG: immune inhibitor A [Flavobacteriales bacterium]
MRIMFTRLFLTCVLSSSVLGALAQQRAVHSRACINLSGHADAVPTLQGLGICLDHTDLSPGNFVSGDFSERDLDLARQAGFEVRVEVADIGAFYAERAAHNTGADKSFGEPGCPGSETYPEPAHFVLGSMGGFYTWQEMQDQLDSMVAHFPALISAKASIGTSHEGRPIHYVRISNNPNVDQAKPEVLYDALHHAREPESAMQLYYFMWYLLENYGTDPLATHIVNTRELYFVPCVNPDGYVHNETIAPMGGGMWRKNRRDNGDGSFGVDLNRNYGYAWGIDDWGSSPSTVSDTYRGPSAFSEPETQAMRDFIVGREFVTRHSHHCRGHLLLYPWGHVNTLCPDSAVFSTYAQRMTEDNGYHFGTTYEALFYLANGSATDWSYGEQVAKPKIFGYVPETGTYIDGFWPQPDRIVPLAQANMEQNIMLALFAGAYAEVKDVSPRVENSTTPSATFALQSLGLQDGTFTISLEPLSNVIAATGPQTFSGLDTLETVTASIGLTLDPLIADGESFSYVLVLDANNLILRDTIERVYGEPLTAFSDNSATDDNWTGGWSLTNEDWFSAPSSFTDSPLSNHSAFENNAWGLAVPINLSLATTATLEFMARWTLQSELDHVQVEASDNGVSWTALCGTWSRPGTDTQLEDEPVYDGKRTDWTLERMALDDFIGGPLYLNFRLRSEDQIEYDGFYLDDVVVTITGDVWTGVEQVATSGASAQCHPSPATTSATVFWALPEHPEDAQWQLVDGRGAVVLAHSVLGRSGRLDVSVGHLASGLYSYRLVSNGLVRAHGRLSILPQ